MCTDSESSSFDFLSAPVGIPSSQWDLIGALEKNHNSFVLLDTASPTRENRFSYLFTSPVKIFTTKDPSEVIPITDQIQTLSKKFWVAGYLAYEAASGLERKIAQLYENHKNSTELLWFGLFREPHIFDHYKGTWNKPLPVTNCQTGSNPQIPSKISFSLSENQYQQKIEKIGDYIAGGDTYQVNFTFDVQVEDCAPSSFDLYRGLRTAQKTPFCAYLKTTSLQAISFSPELFFRLNKKKISVKPMKGTASRGRFESEDKQQIHSLCTSPKNRSENIMIVDLLRNDLGRVCKTNSVKTTKLFQIETHPTVHQMTSTITGVLDNNTGFTELLKALFPCGSVTGAPKIRTMEIIDELEQGKRGIYCGALGFLSPKREAVFSVPIRTLQRKTNHQKWNYRVGSGIIWESQSSDEFRECKTKCSFLTKKRNDFFLFESVLYTFGKPLYLRDHLLRLHSSARYFGFKYDRSALSDVLPKIKRSLLHLPSCKVKLTLSKNGRLEWEYQTIEPAATGDNFAPISSIRIESSNVFLFHKTTLRSWYDEASERIRGGSCWDMIHLNKRDEVTEGARSNVFIQNGSTLFTPALQCGLLNGILRKRLLKSGRCTEKVISSRELFQADAVYCGNSVRGLVRVIITK